MSTFFALKPPPDIAGQLVAMARDHADRYGGRATSFETVHLTLAFLGEFPAPRVDELIAVASGVRASSFDLRVDRLGYWSHNQLLWAGSVSSPPALMTLAARLEITLAAGNCWIAGARDGHPFAPHITLVRKLATPVAPTPLATNDRIVWPCASFVLVRSLRTDAATLHETLAEFTLDLPA
ncbi:MAG: RNA 2',3'-cyclic phosphodiesterase [Propionivibrio sp.]